MSKDKTPFGCYAIYNLLGKTYSEETEVNSQTFYNLKSKLTGASSILLINDGFNFSKTDLASLFEILEAGNTVFLAANEFGGPLADTLHINTELTSFTHFTTIDSLMKSPGESITLTAKNHTKENFQYTKAAWVSSFSSFDTTKFTVLARVKKDKACLLRANYGQGKLYLMSVPDVFGNYFIVNNKNRQLVYAMLSLLNNNNLIWDEYYKTYNVQNTSPLKFIFESDALYAAYSLLFFTIVLYMITEGRRRQKAIPIIEPVNNTTLEFVNVISHVYFNGHNHQSIAAEKIKYFYETVRKKFNVSTNEINEELMKVISELSGIEYKTVKQLFTYCEKVKTAPQIGEFELIELNRQISNFNKNSLR